MDDNGAIVELEGVSFAYPGGEELFHCLSLSVRHGERVGIVGANGSGKTSIFHLVMGLNSPGDGVLRVAGREVRTNADFAFVRRKVGFLFQRSEDQLFCPTVEDDVAFGPLNLGLAETEARRVVGETLADLGLSDYAGRVTGRLSGGEKRLVALATVLAMRPDVLLLDEPANGLDPRTTRRLISLLTRIGRTQFISSHNMEFVRATCERVVVLADGDVVADGPTDDVLRDSGLMLRCGLEEPYSLEAHSDRPAHDHHHGAGPSHGHGHDAAHTIEQHDPGD